MTFLTIKPITYLPNGNFEDKFSLIGSLHLFFNDGNDYQGFGAYHRCNTLFHWLETQDVQVSILR